MSRPALRVLRIVCLAWGALLLLWGIVDELVPRAHYVTSRPGPGSMLGAVPAEIVVTFTTALHPDSTIRVVSTMSLLPSGEASYSGGQEVVATSGLDPNDPSHRSLRAVLQPGSPDGLYYVSWTATEQRLRAERYGSFYFGVGTPVPAHLLGRPSHPFRENDPYNGIERERDAALAGGVILIALALVLPWLRPDSWA